MTTNNDFAALPASEETSDFSRDVSFTSIGDVRLGDRVRVDNSGPYAMLDGVVYWKRDCMVEVSLIVFGMQVIRAFHWMDLKKVG